MLDLDPRLTLRQLEQFVAVADAGGFAPAAAALHLTPNAVAQSVTELERILGADLTVRRRARGVTLTPAGTRLARCARALLRAAVDLADAVAEDDAARGTVRLGCYGPLAPMVLPRWWEDVGRAHPGIRLDLTDGDLPKLAEALRRGELDAVAAYAVNLPGDMHHRPLCSLGLKACLPGGHPLAGGDGVDLADLADEPLVLLDRHPSGENTLNLLRRRGLAPRVAHRVQDLELMRALVARGAGYGLHFTDVTARVCRDGLPAVSLPVAPADEREDVVLAWHPDLPPSPRVEAVLAVAAATFAETAGTA